MRLGAPTLGQSKVQIDRSHSKIRLLCSYTPRLLVEVRCTFAIRLHFTLSLHFTRGPHSAVRSLRFTLTDSKMAAYQQFLKHIYWNFMESGMSGIGIWLNL